MTYTATKDNSGFVYVLLDQSERRKLGLGINVEKRVKQLQTGNAEQITIEYRLAVNDMRRAEKAIHNLFAASRLRINGEWFKLSTDELLLLRKVFKAADTTVVEERQLTLLGLR